MRERTENRVRACVCVWVSCDTPRGPLILPRTNSASIQTYTSQTQTPQKQHNCSVPSSLLHWHSCSPHYSPSPHSTVPSKSNDNDKQQRAKGRTASWLNNSGEFEFPVAGVSFTVLHVSPSRGHIKRIQYVSLVERREEERVGWGPKRRPGVTGMELPRLTGTERLLWCFPALIVAIAFYLGGSTVSRQSSTPDGSEVSWHLSVGSSVKNKIIIFVPPAWFVPELDGTTQSIMLPSFWWR